MAPPPIPDDEWETIWTPLAAQGWRHEGVPGGVNYFFPPGIVKGEGFTLRKDYFDSKRQVVNHLGIEIKPPVPKASPVDRAPKRKRPTPTPADEGAAGTDSQTEEDDSQYGAEQTEERRSSRVKRLRDMPSAEELRIIQEKEAAERAAATKVWLEAQPVASHRSEWLGPANARVPPNRETGEPLTKSQKEKIAPFADFHRAWKLSWFNGAPQSKNMRKTAPFNRMYSNRAAQGVCESLPQQCCRSLPTSSVSCCTPSDSAHRDCLSASCAQTGCPRRC
jgi:hypothetical protein|eukprot:COSAG06_NODE_7898_length_2338_cov_3.501563_2_plen_278_part_00